MSEEILQTNQLTKKFKNQIAVDHVSLTIKKGDIYGFIGRNGAGKTTFLKMICGLIQPTEGEFILFNQQGKGIKQVLNRVGVLIENPGLYSDMSAYDNLKLKLLCTGIDKKGYIEELLGIVGLLNDKHKKVKEFSLGMKQRLGIAMALVGEPDLLILDEPINGLDPQGIIEIRETILKLNRERHMTIIISSHILEELSKIATTYGIIHHGKLIKSISKEDLYEQCHEKIAIKLAQPKKACIVLDQYGINDYKVVDHETIHVFERLEELGNINIALAKQNILIKGIYLHNDQLEDYFIQLTGGNTYD